MVDLFRGRNEIVKAQDEADVGGAVVEKWQAQPVLHHVIFLHTRTDEYALGRDFFLHGAAVGCQPIVALCAPFQFFDAIAGDFALIDFTQPGARESDAAAAQILVDINEAYARQQFWNMAGADIAPCWKIA